MCGIIMLSIFAVMYIIIRLHHPQTDVLLLFYYWGSLLLGQQTALRLVVPYFGYVDVM